MKCLIHQYKVHCIPLLSELFILSLPRCQNFRGHWGDYWYMGEKCEQLWNTLDLILVATLPGITLALIVGVVIQIIHYCKGKPKKNEDHHR